MNNQKYYDLLFTVIVTLSLTLSFLVWSITNHPAENMFLTFAFNIITIGFLAVGILEMQR